MEHCGRSAGRWEALATVMSFGYDEKTVSFDTGPTGPGTPAASTPPTVLYADHGCVRGDEATVLQLDGVPG